MSRNMKVLLIIAVNLCLCAIVSCFMITEEPPVKYEGPHPQTPEAILAAFADIPLVNFIRPEDQQKWNEKYPATEWLQMILDKGIIIEDADDFQQYMLARQRLILHESKSEKWMPKTYFGTTFNDWESYKTAYIDREIWKCQQLKAAKRKNRNVVRVAFLGADGRTVIPITNSSKYVRVKITKHKGMGAGGGMSGGGASKLSEQQKFDIFYKGKHPWGWGWKIIYVDEANNVLPEKPEPINREDLGLPADVPWPPKNREHLDQIIEDVRRRENLENDR